MIATTTLNRIQDNDPCTYSWKKLLQSLGKTEADDEPLTLLYILESNGLEDTITALRAIDDCPEIRLFAVRCVRQVQHMLTDPRSLNVLDVSELHAVGEASDEELAEAESAAWDAVGDAARAVAWDAAGDAARVAAWYAARTTARDVALDTARAVADAAAWAVADAAARYAARTTARDVALDAQELDFRDIFCTDDTLP